MYYVCMMSTSMSMPFPIPVELKSVYDFDLHYDHDLIDKILFFFIDSIINRAFP